MFNPHDLMPLDIHINDQSDLFIYKGEYEVIAAYTPYLDGWEIHLGYFHPDNMILSNEDENQLKSFAGISYRKSFDHNVGSIMGFKLRSCVQYIPEKPPYNSSEIFGWSKPPEEYLGAAMEGIRNLNLETMDEGEGLTEKQLLVKAHRVRSKVDFVAGSKRVESLRWLHQHWDLVLEDYDIKQAARVN